MNYTLENIVAYVENLDQVKKTDLHPGDEIQLKTSNSLYFIKVDQNGDYIVSGGWIDRMYKSPAKLSINGCTWGGSIIKTDIVAACGLYLEFGNRLVTSKIKKIFYFPSNLKN